MSKKLTEEEKLTQQQERDTKRKEKARGKKTYLSDAIRDAVAKEVERIIRSEYYRYVDDAARIRVKDQLAQVPEEQSKRIHDKLYTKFTTKQLLQIFGGWYTLRYLFSVKSVSNGVDIETDYYICSKDVSLMDVNSRPKRNEPIFKQFGVEVYGYAIIAPAAAFN